MSDSDSDWLAKADHEFENSRRLMALEKFSEQVAAERLQIIQGIRDYGAGTIRALFLLNGGTSAALLTLLDRFG